MFERIAKYLSEQLDIPVEEIDRDTTFESLHLDSLDMVEMVVDLEEELGIDLQQEDRLYTVGELADFVEDRLN